jgi:hypothetical protein
LISAVMFSGAYLLRMFHTRPGPLKVWLRSI